MKIKVRSKTAVGENQQLCVQRTNSHRCLVNTSSHVSQHSSFKQAERKIDSYFKLPHYIQEIPIKGILDVRTIWMNEEMGWPTQIKHGSKCTKKHVITAEIQIRKAKKRMSNILGRNENKGTLKKVKAHLKSKNTSKITVLPKLGKNKFGMILSNQYFLEAALFAT